MNTTMTDRQTVRVNPNNPIEVDNLDQTQKDNVASRRSVNFAQACEQTEFDEQSTDTHIAPLTHPNVTQRVNFNPKEKPQRVNEREEAKRVDKRRRKKAKKGKKKKKTKVTKEAVGQSGLGGITSDEDSHSQDRDVDLNDASRVVNESDDTSIIEEGDEQMKDHNLRTEDDNNSIDATSTSMVINGDIDINWRHIIGGISVSDIKTMSRNSTSVENIYNSADMRHHQQLDQMNNVDMFYNNVSQYVKTCIENPEENRDGDIMGDYDYSSIKFDNLVDDKNDREGLIMIGKATHIENIVNKKRKMSKLVSSANLGYRKGVINKEMQSLIYDFFD